MTGSWMAVKWLGIFIAAVYLQLLLFVLVRFRRDMSRLRHGLILPAVLGVFVSVSVPSIFEDVTVSRICFVIAAWIYSGGIAILLRGLAQKDHQSLFKVQG